MGTHLALARTQASRPGRPSGASAPARARPEVRRILYGSSPRIQRQTVPEPDDVSRQPGGTLPYREAMEALERERIDKGPPSGKVCMTFDDGPQDGTEDCLNALAAGSAPGTFFLTGTNMASDAPRQKLLVERMLTEGHQLGNHTFTHDPQADAEYRRTYGDLGDPAKVARFEKNFNDNEAHFRALLGATSPIFSLARLPGDGRFVNMGGKLVYVKQTEGMGLAHVGWNFEFGTTKLVGKALVEKPSFAHLTTLPWQGIAGVSADRPGLPKGGDVILLHDRHWSGKQAKLEAVLTKLRDEGFGFGRLDSSGKCS